MLLNFWMALVMTTRINTYPFFLWLTRKSEATLDFDNMTVTSELGTSTIEEISFLQVLIMKYLPILFMLVAGGNVPTSKDEFAVAGLALIITVVSTLVFIKLPKLFKSYIVLCIFIIYYILWEHMSFAAYVDMAILYLVEITLVTMVIMEFTVDLNSTYYVLKDMKKVTTIHPSKRQKRPLIKLFKWNFIHVNTGFDSSIEYTIGGYYLKVVDND